MIFGKEIVVDPGNEVLCDLCNRDFTTSKESGGALIGSYAACPTCLKKLAAKAITNGESLKVNATCPSHMSFGDWIRSLR